MGSVRGDLKFHKDSYSFVPWPPAALHPVSVRVYIELFTEPPPHESKGGVAYRE